MTKHLVALLSSSLFACGPALEEVAAAEPAALEQELRSSVKVSLRATTSLSAPVRFSTRFELDRTVDLYLVADVSAPPGPHEVMVEISTPSGDLYQATAHAFTTQRGETNRVIATLPVAGTWIQQFMLTGSWQARLFVDGAPRPAASLSFSLK